MQQQQGWDAASVLVEFYYQLFVEREREGRGGWKHKRVYEQ